MASKSPVLLAALLLLVAAVGQVRCGPSVALTPNVLTTPVTVLVSSIVPCSTGSSINVAAVPPFPNATAQLVCGSNAVANATAGANGAVVINLGPLVDNLLPLVFSLLTGQCRVVVTTPLVTCNAALAGATGTLIAPLQLLGNTTTTAGVVIGNIGGLTVVIVNGLIIFVTGLFSFV